MNNPFFRNCSVLLAFVLLATACSPREPVVLRRIDSLKLEVNAQPTVYAEAVLYNPNKNSGKIKKLSLEIFVDNKLAGTIEEDLDLRVKGLSEFHVPFRVNLNLKESGLLDTLLNIFGARKADVHFRGYLKMNLSGIPVNIPIDHSQEVKFSL